MFAISGVTGHVGGAAARELLAQGHPIRVIVRDAAKGASWAARGAEVAVASLSDPTSLRAALADATGFFALLPTDDGSTDVLGDHRRMAAAIATAVAQSGVPHVVLLSSLGADLAAGTGPIAGLHELEVQMRATGARLTCIRPGFFQETVAESLDPARHLGIYPSFNRSADEPVSMVATRDIGRLVAASLANPPSASEVVDILGPETTSRQIAAKLGAALGKPVQVVDIPPEGWMDALARAGLSRHFAELLAEMYAAVASGAVVPRGDRLVQATTEIDETIAALVG
jgi:uncharacterized protein YbjT (DUF2867 family)